GLAAPSRGLPEDTEACRVAEVSRAKELELLRVSTIVVGAARDAFDGVDDDVGLDERGLLAEEVRRYSAEGQCQHGGEFRGRHRALDKMSSRAATAHRGVECGVRPGGGGEWHGARGRRARTVGKTRPADSLDPLRVLE